MDRHDLCGNAGPDGLRCGLKWPHDCEDHAAYLPFAADLGPVTWPNPHPVNQRVLF